MENQLFREFRRRFHHYSSHVPGCEEKLRWLSLMQHHGAPTRLQDWTYSIFVAAYFALEYATDNCALWAIDKEWLEEEGRRTFKANSREETIFESDRDEKVERDFEHNVINEKLPRMRAVIQINPFQLDERLTLQKGLFLCPCDVTTSFENNLRAFRNYHLPEYVLKLRIAKKDRENALKDLHSMNISRATLFPGLDGFAQSLAVYHPLL